jgi:chromosome partitioning protein
MRIRRRDKEGTAPPGPTSATPPSAPLESQVNGAPTSVDPVKRLVTEPPLAAQETAPSPAPRPAESDAAPEPVSSSEPPTAAEEPKAEMARQPTTTQPKASPAGPRVTEKATPAPAASAAPTAPATPVPRAEQEEAPQMRKPSIGEEANQLLNGDRPAMRDLPRVIAIANQKGGVGKTTTTVNLGAALAEQGYRVLVVDLDPQGNATTGLGVEARNFEFSMYDVIMREQPLEDCIEPTSVKNLFVAPATIDLAGIEIELVPAFSRELKLKKAIDSVVDDFDFVLIDCPPSLGLITVNGLAAAAEVMVPIQCEYYALEGLSQLLRNVNLVSANLNESLEVTTIVLTMYDARTRLSVDVANEVREHFAERVCKVVIPRTVRLSEAPSFGQPITVFDPASRGAVAYRELAKEVSNGAPQRTR